MSNQTFETENAFAPGEGWQMMKQGFYNPSAKTKQLTAANARMLPAAGATTASRIASGVMASTRGVRPKGKMDRSDFFAKQQAGKAMVKKGYIQRPVSRGKARRLSASMPLLPAVGGTSSAMSKRAQAAQKGAATRAANKARKAAEGKRKKKAGAKR